MNGKQQKKVGHILISLPVRACDVLHTQPRAKTTFCVAAHPHSAASVQTKITILETKIKECVLHIFLSPLKKGSEFEI